MTFTQFLRNPAHLTTTPSFLQLVRHDALWPAQSNRLQDFEAFLAARLEEEGGGAILELRALWREYAEENRSEKTKDDLDLALAAWGDYAAHLKTCTASAADRCPAAAELLERAVAESSFDDLYLARPSPPCEGVDEGAEDEDGDEPPIGSTRQMGDLWDEAEDIDE